MTPASGLLLRLVSDSPDLAVLADPASWRLIKENAGPSGMAPLVAFTARSHVPKDERLWCDKVLTQSWVRYEQSLHHLDYELGILEAEGIRALALKGPLLARRHYNPPFLRKPSIDLDLAIHERDLDRACEALAREGYTLIESIRRAKMLSHHAVLSHPAKRRIELHFRLSHHTAGIRVDELFGRAVPHELPGGRVAWVLAPADEALHLILHAVNDRFGTLFHLYEIRRIWRAMPLNLRMEAVQRGVDRHFAGALKMVDVAFRSLWGDGLLPPDAQLPETWLHRRLNEKLFRSFEDFWEAGHTRTLMNRLRGRWLDFQTTDRPADAAKFAADLARTAWFQLRRGSQKGPLPPAFIASI